MKRIFFFSVVIFLPRIIFAQEFYFKCTYRNDITPVLFVVPEDNVFENLILNRIPLIKDSGRSAHVSLKPSKITFLKIGFDAVLISPGDRVEGTFNGSDFEPHDTNSINFTLTTISRGFSSIVNKYPVGGDFNLFKSVVDTLNQYMDSTNAALTNHSTGLLAEDVSIALKEYLSVRLAHFLVLPILLKNDYDKNQLREIIRKNIQIRYPEYWLQLESGRIFLQCYYRKISLPDANFNLQKSVEDKFFAFHTIRKLAYYNYFLECVEKGIVKSQMQLLDDWHKAKSKLILSNKEQESMQEVYNNILDIGVNISDVFTTLPLANEDGKVLSIKEKKDLILPHNVIIDFWASWCVPCKQKMNKLNSDHVTLNNKQYRIIYLSIDQDENKWKQAHFPFLNKTNSFRITKENNPFMKDFNIRYIPRYMLIDQSALISSKFEF